jgi:hypothetical protein
VTAPELVLAHLGGVPEALTIGMPIGIFTGFMLLERRARRRERERTGEHRGDGPGEV